MEICVLQNPIKVNWPKRSGRESGNHAYFFWLRGKITWRQNEPQTISFINASAVQRQAEEHTPGCCSYILLLANPALHWHLTKKYWNPSGALEVNHFTKVNNTDIPASVWTTIPIAEIWPQRVPSIRVKLSRKSRITTHNRYNTKIPACGQIFVSINHAGRLIVCLSQSNWPLRKQSCNDIQVDKDITADAVTARDRDHIFMGGKSPQPDCSPRLSQYWSHHNKNFICKASCNKHARLASQGI